MQCNLFVSRAFQSVQPSLCNVHMVKQQSMVIRSANPEDIDRCCELLAHLFEQETEFLPDQELQQNGLRMIIEHPSKGTVLVCTDGQKGVITGMVVLLYTISTALGKKVALLEDMIVDPAYRSQGIGTQLLQNAIHHARNMGLARITLLADHTNATAFEFYGKNGFTRSGMVVFRKIISSS